MTRMLKVFGSKSGSAFLTLSRKIAADASRKLRHSRPVRVNRAAARIWREQLDTLDPDSVRAHLNTPGVAQAGRQARIPLADAGVMFGQDRFPPRAFIEKWLGDSQAEMPDVDGWRVRVLALAALAGAVSLLVLANRYI